MKMKLEAATPRALFVVFADPLPEHEAEFNRWYDEVHGPDALGNGSFTALHRFRAVGPGYRATPYLALWEAPYDSEAEAWAYIGPRAQALREAGRAGGEVASVRYALMLVAASMEDGPGLETVGSLVTCQNDWRDTATAPTARTFWLGLPPEARRAPVRWLVTSDAAGRGAGHHLAILAYAENATEPAGSTRTHTAPSTALPTGVPAAAGIAAGMLVAIAALPDDLRNHRRQRRDEHSCARAWRMTWEPVISQRA